MVYSIRVSAEENAVKELSEEVGATFADDARIEVIGSITADSGIMSGKVSIVYCEISSYEEKIGYEEIQKTILLSERELDDWIKRGRIDDGFTLAAYSLFSLSADLR